MRSDGLNIEYQAVCVKAGGYNERSNWRVTLTRNGQTFEVVFYNSIAARRWKESAHTLKNVPGFNYAFKGKFLAGQHVPMTSRKYTDPDFIAAFNKHTEPEAPTLDDVLACLLLDAQSVCYGQSFEEFCSDLGYDSDSRTAERTFNGCRDEWTGLVRLALDLDDLSKRYEDY